MPEAIATINISRLCNSNHLSKYSMHLYNQEAQASVSTSHFARLTGI